MSKTEIIQFVSACLFAHVVTSIESRVSQMLQKCWITDLLFSDFYTEQCVLFGAEEKNTMNERLFPNLKTSGSFFPQNVV